MRNDMQYPKVDFPEITKVRNRVYYVTYIRLLPQRYERIFKKIKSLVSGRLHLGR